MDIKEQIKAVFELLETKKALIQQGVLIRSARK